jgi:signal peptidase I
LREAGEHPAPQTAGGAPQARRSGLWESLQTLLVAVLLALVVRTFVVESFVVQGVSMLPTFESGEHVLVNKLAYVFGRPEPNQIIVFRPPLPGANEDFIKRVVAVAGETVLIRNGHLYINGHRVAQPYIEYWDPTSYGPVKVPPGDVFVLGDNRPDSEDSRYFGPVPVRNIRGQVIWAFWPLSRFGPVGEPAPGARGYRA